ncbi:MAG: prolipoprotein diacylglyceryl transferase [Desulfomonile tiedjei]|uniref:Phosphatidylglycerol--prolipoprotein diacylglyceryl transferase n=1 Tax=Desulfomonile tiedjei TaxID=2358 RepID=A0A9D6Z0F0_9BACT|nr:prolipoprotein diacylglyceryl transferase [Desulfomonile tiedjei]
MAAPTCPFIDPVLAKLGPVEIPWLGMLGPIEVRWYGLMYLLGFVAAYFVIKSELKRKQGPIPAENADDFLFYLIVGLLLGGRLGYILFYNLPAYLSAPWEVFFIWHGGMSFHGGLVGMIVSGLVFARTRHVDFMELADIGALSSTIGLMLGRIGNFINCELFGRATNLPWGIVFPGGGELPRHPSQLYEAFFEGPVLFGILWWLRVKATRPGELLAAFLVGYGLFRFSIEFLREPDPQLGFILHGLTMGQILCLFMMGAGAALFVYLRFFGKQVTGQPFDSFSLKDEQK